MDLSTKILVTLALMVLSTVAALDVNDKASCPNFPVVSAQFITTSCPGVLPMTAEQATFSPNASSIIMAIIGHLDVKSSILGNISQTIGFESSSTYLADSLEVLFRTEPYYVYGLADLIIGFDITTEDLRTFGIDGKLVMRENLQLMYQTYFDAYCSKRPLRAQLACTLNLLENTCGLNNLASPVMDYFTTFESFYCDNSLPYLADLKTDLYDDLGTVWAPLVDLFVTEDPDSSYLFQLNSFIEDNFEKFREECSYLIESTTISYFVEGLFNRGIEDGFTWIHRQNKQVVNCAIRLLEAASPGFIENNAALQKHFNVLSQRYGFSAAIDWTAKIDLAAERKSATVYGGTYENLVVFDASMAVACPLRDMQVFLRNRFMTLSANISEPVRIPESGTLSKVSFYFHRENAKLEYDSQGNPLPTNIVYISGEGDINQSFTTRLTDGDKERMSIKGVAGNGIQIIDYDSGTVIVVNKFGDGYYFTVRMSSDLVENSVGLLVTGCAQEDVDISTENLNSEEADCTGCNLNRLTMDVCKYDCLTLGPSAMSVNRSQAVMQQWIQAREDDSLLNKPQNPNSGTNSLHSSYTLLSFSISAVYFSVKLFLM